jgi:hypothetical protein
MSMLVFWVVTPCGLVGRHLLYVLLPSSGPFLRDIGIYPHGVTPQKTNIGEVEYGPSVPSFGEIDPVVLALLLPERQN